MVIVEVKNLSKSYGEIKAVNEVSFKVKKARFLVFWGLMALAKQLLWR